MSTGVRRDENAATPSNGIADVSVIICAYTYERWEKTRAAVKSVTDQCPRPREVLLVVDHNPDLESLARREIPEVRVIPNSDAPGLSGARNTGLRAARREIAVFLDDDAEAHPGWLKRLIEAYGTAGVVATGGGVHPIWPARRPRWMPSEFDWVVGCSYRGLPEEGGPIRNPIGANMSVRADLALAAGGFTIGIGRVGRHPRGCEETELAIRLVARNPGSFVYYVPEAAVDHHVPPERARPGYFVRRCWHEGKSKATVTFAAGSGAALQCERRQALIVIPRAVLRELRRGIAGDAAAFLRMAVSITGLLVTTLGYLAGTCEGFLSRHGRKRAIG